MVDAITQNESAGTVETRADYEKTPSDYTKHWLKAIELADTTEKGWRDQAKDTIDRYRGSKNRSFNILYANTETVIPALYNSEPAPDVRRRFGDEDPAGQNLATILERALSIQCEMYDFDGAMKAAVKDRQLPGRGVTRVRVKTGQRGSKSIVCEPVQWDEIRIGPSKTWADVPWVAFLHHPTREELVEIAGREIAMQVQLDEAVSDAPKKDTDKLPDTFKRARMWEVWEKATRRTMFFAESFTDGPLKVISDDPYKLRNFFPMPQPLYQVESTDTLIPVCEFTIWKHLADEVDNITRRISAIIKVMKLRGLYDGAFANLIKTLSGLDDGELGSAEDSGRAMQQGGLDKAIWMFPVDMAMKVVTGLYEAREQAKNELYELTGVADILRGSTQASETATAQQIKAQWGSLRLQEDQRDVQRYARDLYRIMADLIGEVFTPPELEAMTGIPFRPAVPAQLPPEQIAMANKAADAQAQKTAGLLKSDLQREFVIEIETDSTIRADLSRAQQNITGFGEMFGAFIEKVGPAVQSGMMPAPLAVKMLVSFARMFKLPREGEQVLDEWIKFLEQKAQQPPQPSPEQQKAQVEMQQMQAEAQAKQAERAQELQAKQQSNAMDLQMKQAELALKEKELQLKERELGMKAQAMQQEHAFRMHAAQEDAAMQQQNRAKDAEFEDERRTAELAFMKQRQAARPSNGAAQ